MSLFMLLLAAAPASDKPSASLLAGAETFDLKQLKPADPCARPSSEEIVVCGRAKNDEISVRNPARFEDKPLRAETGLFGRARIDAHAEQHATPDGKSAPAAMVRIKIPF